MRDDEGAQLPSPPPAGLNGKGKRPFPATATHVLTRGKASTGIWDCDWLGFLRSLCSGTGHIV